MASREEDGSVRSSPWAARRTVATLLAALLTLVGSSCNRESVADTRLIGEARLSVGGLADGPAPATFGPGPATLSADPPSDPGAQMRIAGGRLTNDPSGPGRAAGYYTSADLGAPITRIGARWTFTPRGGTPGAMALVVSRNGLNLPFSVHLNITPQFWSFGVWPADGGPETGLQTLGFARFDAPLAQDGTTELETEVVIDGERADIALPDGEHHVVRDPRIAEWAGSFATFESYADDGLTDSRAGFTDVWAESREER